MHVPNIIATKKSYKFMDSVFNGCYGGRWVAGKKNIYGIIKQSSSKLPTEREELAKTIPVWISVVARWLGKTLRLQLAMDSPWRICSHHCPKGGRVKPSVWKRRNAHFISFPGVPACKHFPTNRPSSNPADLASSIFSPFYSVFVHLDCG